MVFFSQEYQGICGDVFCSKDSCLMNMIFAVVKKESLVVFKETAFP
jgi:hypothetical protein